MFSFSFCFLSFSFKCFNFSFQFPKIFNIFKVLVNNNNTDSVRVCVFWSQLILIEWKLRLGLYSKSLKVVQRLFLYLVEAI